MGKWTISTLMFEDLNIDGSWLNHKYLHWNDQDGIDER